MKKIIASLIIVGLSVTFASADWVNIFKEYYEGDGIEVAVDKAVQDGIAPDLIVKTSLGIDLDSPVNPQTIIKALYCAGVTGEDVYFAAESNNITDIIVAAGFTKSVEECGDMVTETQPYTPVKVQGVGFGGPNKQNSRSSASPSN